MENGARKPVTVIAVDNDPLAQQSLAIMLNDADLQVLAICGTADECLAAATRQPPNVAIVDMHLGGRRQGGVDLIRRLVALCPNTACLVFTAVDPTGELLPDALSAGARGYYRKGYMRGEDLTTIIHSLAAGKWIIEPELANSYIQWVHRHRPDEALPADEDGQPQLTVREMQTLSLVLTGLTSKAIAEKLFIAESTVKTHREHAAAKLGFGTDSYLAAIFAGMKGLLNTQSDT